MKRIVILLALATFVLGFSAIVAPSTTVAAGGGINCSIADPQPGKGKTKCILEPPYCQECVCVGHCKWECTPIPGCI